MHRHCFPPILSLCFVLYRNLLLWQPNAKLSRHRRKCCNSKSCCLLPKVWILLTISFLLHRHYTVEKLASRHGELETLAAWTTESLYHPGAITLWLWWWTRQFSELRERLTTKDTARGGAVDWQWSVIKLHTETVALCNVLEAGIVFLWHAMFDQYRYLTLTYRLDQSVVFGTSTINKRTWPVNLRYVACNLFLNIKITTDASIQIFNINVHLNEVSFKLELLCPRVYHASMSAVKPQSPES